MCDCVCVSILAMTSLKSVVLAVLAVLGGALARSEPEADEAFLTTPEHPGHHGGHHPHPPKGPFAAKGGKEFGGKCGAEAKGTKGAVEMHSGCSHGFKAGFEAGSAAEDMLYDTHDMLRSAVQQAGLDLPFDADDFVPEGVLDDLDKGVGAEWGGMMTVKYGCKAGVEKGPKGIKKGVECGVQAFKGVSKKWGPGAQDALAELEAANAEAAAALTDADNVLYAPPALEQH